MFHTIWGFENYVDLFSKKSTIFSAICIQESWMPDVKDTSLVDIPEYTCIYKGKTCSNNGGVIIYLLKKLVWCYHWL